jgi:hypothetical protein
MVIIIFILLLIIQCDMLHAQRFKGAVMFGMNISQVDGDEVFGYHRFGVHFGAAAILPIKNWDITLETVYNQKGSFRKAIFPADSLNGQYDLRLNYVEVPLLVHYTDKNVITVGAGFSWGRLVNAREIEHSGAQPPYSDTVSFNKNDFDVLADVQIKIWKRLKFGVRFAYSMVPIRERLYHPVWEVPWTREQYNNLLTFRLVYVINEVIQPKPAKE